MSKVTLFVEIKCVVVTEESKDKEPLRESLKTSLETWAAIEGVVIANIDIKKF